MDIGGLILYKILESPSESLESWTKIKNVYFSGEYLTIYSSIAKFYDKNSYLPCFNELTISIRDGLTKSKINALGKLEVSEDIPLELAVTALTDEFAQSEALLKIDKFVDNVHLLDSEEIKEEIADILLYLEEKTHSSESICTMKDLSIMEKEEAMNDLIPLGINNTFDSEIRMATTELLMLGGKVGTGKSVVSTNMIVNQYLMGNSTVYFSVEMRSREPFNRIMAMMSGVESQKLRFANLTEMDYDKLADARCDFFEDGEDALEVYKKNKDFGALQRDLQENRILKPDNQIIIVDNNKITLMDIDMTIQKYKAQFGDKLKVVVVDYVNQIQIEDIYSWKSQIMLSKGLKDLGKKYNVVMITPYQIDREGTARFSKGIEDAADISMTLTAEETYIGFKSTKTRGTAPFSLASGVNWPTLRIDPADVNIEVSVDVEEPKIKNDDDTPF